VLACVLTHAVVGLEARPVEVEAQIRGQQPGFVLVGLGDRACQEAKERVRGGFVSAGLRWPRERLIVNLAPAALKKEGAGFDLPIAIAILVASGQMQPDRVEGLAAVGEIALGGHIRPVAGTVVVAEAARRAGAERILCATESAPEAALGGIEAIPVGHLREAADFLWGELQIEPCGPPEPDPCPPAYRDLADVRGQERARRALELAAAGGHNLLLAGPPGTGKSMLARRLPGILPPLTFDEALDVTRVWSVAGLLRPGHGLMHRRPFRAPHHSASMPAIVGGGGGRLRPGEATLAHNGVLLLDELPEFARPALEALRQPLEDGSIAVARVEGRAVFPADFQLVGTMNLCPCGARGDPKVSCSCSPQRLAAFRDKLSRALLDRFDLVVTVPRPRAEELAAEPGEPSTPVRERVVEARERLADGGLPRTAAADDLLDRAVESLPLSGRGRARVARVSLTIAALARADAIDAEHVAEALAYRAPAELAA